MFPPHRTCGLRVEQLVTGEVRETAYMHIRGADGARRQGPWVELHDVSPVLVAAVIRAEDPRFFRHRGVDWREVWNAARDAVRRRPIRGASTITQQLARNLYLHPGRGVARKVQEWWIAHRMERVLDKRRILELYLNVVEWGDRVWGIAAAAAVHCECSPAGLDAFDAAVLVSLLPAPRLPLRGRNARRAWWSQQATLYNLCTAGYVEERDWASMTAAVKTLGESVDAGLPLADCVRSLRRAHASSWGTRRTVAMTLEQVIGDECGFGRGAPFIRYLERLRADRRANPARQTGGLVPHRWSS